MLLLKNLMVHFYQFYCRYHWYTFLRYGWPTFVGMYTNNDLVKQVFTSIPSKRSYDHVQKAYFNLYQKNLNADLEEEMSAQEYNEIIPIGIILQTNS